MCSAQLPCHVGGLGVIVVTFCDKLDEVYGEWNVEFAFLTESQQNSIGRMLLQ